MWFCHCEHDREGKCVFGGRMGSLSLIAVSVVVVPVVRSNCAVIFVVPSS